LGPRSAGECRDEVGAASQSHLHPWQARSFDNLITADSRYLHFQVTPAPAYHTEAPPLATPIPLPAPARALRAPPRPGTAQWVNCDIRNFDFSVLGQ
jgi:hypothetical protein